MKKIILSTAITIGLTMASFGQSFLFEDNSGAAYDTTIGGVANTTQDLNLQVLFGTSATSVNTSIMTLLLSSADTSTSSSALGQTLSAAGDITAFGGAIYDNSGAGILWPAADAGATLYLQVLAWTGNYSSYADAAAAKVAVGQSSVFTITAGATPTAFPNDISGVGVIDLVPVPEPTTMALAGLGGLALLLFRRKK